MTDGGSLLYFLSLGARTPSNTFILASSERLLRGVRNGES